VSPQMEIKAFKALRLDAAVVGDLGRCIAPPYDVIDERQREKLYNSSEYNIVRITKEKAGAQNSTNGDQYTRAGRLFNEWLEKGVLKADPVEAIYPYVQDFDINGRSYRRSGFVALGGLEEFGRGVWPHERTMNGPKVDRLNLMRATGAQFGQIFMLYDDPENIADGIIRKSIKQPAEVDFVDDGGVRHRLFKINDPSDIQAISNMMTDKQVIIADGHHRYETALNYYKETGRPEARYRMMTFVNIHSEGLIILPVHRVLKNLKDFDIKKLLAGMQENFEITEFSSSEQKQAVKQQTLERLKALSAKGEIAFGLYAGDGAFYTIVLKNLQALESIEQCSLALRRLDVSVLHELILRKVLGIGDSALASQSNVEYISELGDAIAETIRRIDERERQAVFFMNPARIEQVWSIASQGEKMPQKSTYFYPKIFTGLAIHKIAG
jgi:uncharacterized protein (DUF1015 family)